MITLVNHFKYLSPNNILPERRQRQFGHFEMLISERDTDEGDVKKDTEKQMSQANPYSSEEYPQNIHNDRQTAAVSVVNHLAAERP